MRGSVSYQAQIAFNFANGIGSSKKANRENSKIKGQNGHKISDKIHSLKSKDQFIRLTKEILQHQRTQFKMAPDLHNLTTEHLSSFINSKIEKGTQYNTISTYLSQFHKLSISVNKIEDKSPQKIKDKREPSYNLADIKNIRLIAKQEAISNVHINRAYTNPNAIQAHLNGKELLSFQLQKDYGLRVSAATQININQFKNNNRFSFKNKGGKPQTISLDKNLYNNLKNAVLKNNGHYIPYNQYLKVFKKAVTKSGQNYFGTHGLRYSHCQSKFNQYQKDGLNSDQALLKVSRDLGHNRPDITKYYLK